MEGDAVGHPHFLLLMIVAEEICHFRCALFENFDTRQVYNAEVIGVIPVEAAAVNQEDFFVAEQIKGELFVVGDIEFLNIDTREHVECCLGLHTGNAGNVSQSIINKLSLFVNTSSGNDVIFNTLVTAESCLHTMDCAGTLEQRRMFESILRPSI